MRTAFSEVPRKWLIFKICLIHRKNNSIAQRRLYKSAMSRALAVRSLVKMRNAWPVSITPPNFADKGRHRVVARSRETLWKISGPIADDRASRWHRPIFDHRERRIGLELRDNATAGLMQPRPPAVVVVTEVENVGRSRLDRHLLGDRDVIDVGRSHHEIKRLVGIRIVDDVRLGAANSCRKRRPIAAQTAQLHARGIDQTDAIANFATISTLQLRHQRRQQAGKHFEGTRSISRRERRLRNGAASEMISLLAWLRRFVSISRRPRALHSCPYNIAIRWALVLRPRGSGSAWCSSTSRSRTVHGMCFSSP